jgi:hypothetical protein
MSLTWTDRITIYAQVWSRSSGEHFLLVIEENGSKHIAAILFPETLEGVNRVYIPTCTTSRGYIATMMWLRSHAYEQTDRKKQHTGAYLLSVIDGTNLNSYLDADEQRLIDPHKLEKE